MSDCKLRLKKCKYCYYIFEGSFSLGLIWGLSLIFKNFQEIYLHKGGRGLCGGHKFIFLPLYDMIFFPTPVSSHTFKKENIDVSDYMIFEELDGISCRKKPE
jgi:hypothetical protein